MNEIGSKAPKYNPFAQAEARARRNLPFLMSGKLLAAHPEPEWLISSILPEDALCVLYGQRGSYKTFLALDWACCVASGLPWHGKPVRGGDVLYIIGEGSKKAFARRYEAWCKARGQMPDRVRFLPEPLNVTDKDAMGHLIDAATLDSLQPRLIVLDTLARCFGDGDENNTKDMNRFIAGADALRAAFPDATVLIVHHEGKNAKRGSRGSTALEGAVSMVAHLSVSGSRFVTLRCTKQRDAEEFAPITLERRKVEGSLFLEPVSLPNSLTASNGDPRAGKNDQRALAALRAAPGALTFSEWQKKAEMAQSTFRGVLKRLLGGGRVISDGSRYRCAEAGTAKSETAAEEQRTAAA